MADTPCAEQSEAAIGAWLNANVKFGVLVALRHTHGGMLRYERGEVVRLGRGRFQVAVLRKRGVVDKTSASFFYSGRSCLDPKGQTRLVIPTDAVLHACDVCDSTDGFLPGGPWVLTFGG